MTESDVSHDLLVAAASLRWSRPDLTGALADHVVEAAAAEGDRELWLVAAGWAVHARSATGDGRVVASASLDGLARWGTAPLKDPAARRLRVELAVLATDAGEMDTARALLAPVAVAGTEPGMRADAYCALARCAAEDRPADVAEAVRRAAQAWSEVGGSCGEVGGAAVALVAAATDRQTGRVAEAVDRAAEGLARLDRGLGVRRFHAAPGFLAAALAAEWILALVGADRWDEARDGCVELGPYLRETTRPSRHTAWLRLTVACTLATSPAAHSVNGTRIAIFEDATEALELAVREAADSDAPDLESVCRSTLGARLEQAGRLEEALESMRLGVAAQCRDRVRGSRFLTALQTAVPDRSDVALERARAGAPSFAVRRHPVDRVVSRPVDDVDPTHASGADMSDIPDEPDGDAPIVDLLAYRLLQDSGHGGDDQGRVGVPEHEPSCGHPDSADPWSTGRWPLGLISGPADGSAPTEDPDGRLGAGEDSGPPVDPSMLAGEGEGVLAQGGGRGAAEADRVEDIPVTSPAPAAEGDIEQGNLRQAAGLDRVGERPDSGPPTAVPSAGPAGGCVVAIDVARDGRRFAGRRPGAIVRAVADLLTDRLPPEARVQRDDADALSVELPGWDRSTAEEWMHRTLPGLLEELVVVEDLFDAHLRATVRDADGLVGARLLRRLDPGPDRGAGMRPGGSAPASPESGASAPPAAGRRRAPEGSGGAVPPAAAPDPDREVVAPLTSGRHDATGRNPFRIDGQQVRPGSGGRRYRRGADEQPPSAPSPTGDPTSDHGGSTDGGSTHGGSTHGASIDGLGLADLLAGALAAYRDI